MDDRLEKTLTISKKNKEHNYELIEIWECVFQNAISQSPELQDFIEECKIDENQKTLDPRDAFFGGRTGNTVKGFNFQDGEKIKYVDVCSLYPFIYKRGRYPVDIRKFMLVEKNVYVSWVLTTTFLKLTV